MLNFYLQDLWIYSLLRLPLSAGTWWQNTDNKASPGILPSTQAQTCVPVAINIFIVDLPEAKVIDKADTP